MKSYYSKKFFLIIAFAFGFLSAFLIMYLLSYSYIFSSNFDAKKYESKLLVLGKESLISKDIPVASLLIYDGKIIGEGKNDVLKNNNPSGHAEINAIEDCFKKIGYQKFSKLKQQQLTLLSTYEPCEMCKGAIEEYGIKNVVFSFAKRKMDKYCNLKNDLKYHFNLRQMKNKRLQYDLFKMHPSFDSVSYPY
jgi:tRNA(Arg) A34 adenosine deaminase TadA